MDDRSFLMSCPMPRASRVSLILAPARWIVLLAVAVLLGSGLPAMANPGSDAPEEKETRRKVARGDDAPQLWQPSGEVRRVTIQRGVGASTATRASKEELDLLAQRRRERSRETPKHGKSWLRHEVEFDPAQAKPLSPTTPLPPTPLPSPSQPSPSQPSPSKAAGGEEGGIVLFVDTDVATGFGEVPEPTAVAVGNYALYTANHFYGQSFDGGQDFELLSSAQGPFAPPAGTEFCCDQTSVYDPTTNAIFFLQQYIPTDNTGIQRISVDQGANGSFECFYDITPQVAGFPDNHWADFPDLAISSGHLFHASNVFETPVGGPAVGAFILRYPLADIAACIGFEAENVIDMQFNGFRFARGAGATMYYASHISNESLRIWTWPDAQTEPSFVDRSVTPWMTGERTCEGPEGREYCAGVDDRLQSGWVADGVVGFMWVPAQGGGFPFPYVRVAKFSISGLVLTDEIDISSQLSAFVYPSVAVNSNDDLGGTLMAGGGEFPVTGFVWVADDQNGDQLEPIELELASVSGFGPLGGRTGDYTMTRPYYPDNSLWVGTTYGFLGDPGGGQTIQFPAFHIFGRVGTVQPLIFEDGFESGDISAWQ